MDCQDLEKTSTLALTVSERLIQKHFQGLLDICKYSCTVIARLYVTQGLKTRRLLLPRAKNRPLAPFRPRARGLNREGFSSLQFFNSAGVREFSISCKVVTRF